MLSLPAAGRFARPGRNLILGRLSPSDRALIDGNLMSVDVQDGQTIHYPGAPISDIHFPETAVVSLDEGTGGRPDVEIALVGYEGLVGWPALLGRSHSAHRATVEMQGGTTLRIEVTDLLTACRVSPTLLAVLLSFVQSIAVQMANAIVTHLGTSLDLRIARWLLMRHDRVGGDQLFVQHDQIAADLDARRASITHRLHILEGERLIRSKRGRIDVRDRSGLEVFAGDAYGRCEADYRAAIAPFGKSASESPKPFGNLLKRA